VHSHVSGRGPVGCNTNLYHAKREIHTLLKVQRYNTCEQHISKANGFFYEIHEWQEKVVRRGRESRKKERRGRESKWERIGSHFLKYPLFFSLSPSLRPLSPSITLSPSSFLFSFSLALCFFLFLSLSAVFFLFLFFSLPLSFSLFLSLSFLPPSLSLSSSPSLSLCPPFSVSTSLSLFPYLSFSLQLPLSPSLSVSLYFCFWDSPLPPSLLLYFSLVFSLSRSLHNSLSHLPRSLSTVFPTLIRHVPATSSDNEARHNPLTRLAPRLDSHPACKSLQHSVLQANCFNSPCALSVFVSVWQSWNLAREQGAHFCFFVLMSTPPNLDTETILIAQNWHFQTLYPQALTFWNRVNNPLNILQ